MKKAIILIASLLAVLAVSGCSTGKRNAKDSGYDVYLLIGQSNMAGRGKMLPTDTLTAIEGVYLLGAEDTPVPARNPLNRYSTIRKSLSMQQIGPGVGFSQEMYKHNGREILLVVNAKGGSKLREWTEGTEFYSEAVRRAREAMKYGILKGILWHQGCSDSSEEDTRTYLDRLAPMVEALRRDLGVGDEVPFIAGELARWRPASGAFNSMIHKVSEVIPNSSFVSSEGCGPLDPASLETDSPDPHFSRDGQLILGRRYAEKFLEMTD